MILAVDIGNTSTTIGLYHENELIERWTIASDKTRSEDEYGIILYNLLSHYFKDENFKIDGAIISCVVLPMSERFKIAIEKYLKTDVLVVNHKSKTSIKIALDNPKEAGADRIVNAHSAYISYKAPIIVVDFGTATTFDIVNKNGEFIGGLITAGMKIQADSLNKFTSKLPNLKIEAPKNAIGRNTIDAMLSGVVRGHCAMIEGMISQCEKELGEKATIVATGGYSSILAEYMTRPFDYINKNLTLDGLNSLWQLHESEPN